MDQVKTFSDKRSYDDEVNAWLKQNPEVEIKAIYRFPMHDFYEAFSPPQICNQWADIMIVYTLREAKTTSLFCDNADLEKLLRRLE